VKLDPDAKHVSDDSDDAADHLAIQFVELVQCAKPMLFAGNRFASMVVGSAHHLIGN
jgi:hypothetical protein